MKKPPRKKSKLNRIPKRYSAEDALKKVLKEKYPEYEDIRLAQLIPLEEPYHLEARIGLGDLEKKFLKPAHNLILTSILEREVFPMLSSNMTVTLIASAVPGTPYRYTILVGSDGRPAIICECAGTDLKDAVDYLTYNYNYFYNHYKPIYRQYGLTGIDEPPYLYLIFPNADPELMDAKQIVAPSSERTHSPNKIWTRGVEVDYSIPSPTIEVITEQNSSPKLWKEYLKYKKALNNIEKAWIEVGTKVLCYPLLLPSTPKN